jgi:hypothetical protein
VKRAVRADLARFKAFIEMQEVETGAWRGAIEDGEVVKEHPSSYDKGRDYADFEDIHDREHSHSPQTRSGDGSSGGGRSGGSKRKNTAASARGRSGGSSRKRSGSSSRRSSSGGRSNRRSRSGSRRQTASTKS